MGVGASVENSTWKSSSWKDGQCYKCSFELYPKRQGKNYVVFEGTAATYSQRHRCWLDPTKVVVKAMRHLTPKDASLWDVGYMQCYAVCKRIVREYNNYLHDNNVSATVTMVHPAVAPVRSVSTVMSVSKRLKCFSKQLQRDEFVLFEEKLAGDFEQFTLENGECGLGGNDVVEALGHFAFHNSDALFVFCRLRGVCKGGTYRLIAPEVHSIDQRFGDSDQGQTGVRLFFENHQCTSLCYQLRHFEEETELLKV